MRRLYHLLLAFVAALVYGFPSRHLTVIGVTGTKGKSTVVELIAFILEHAGKKTVVSSSIRNDASGMTMPGRFFLERLLRRGVRKGCEYAVIEVTSQGIVQSRHRFIEWSVAVFTNLAPEHIEAHGSFEKYRAAKIAFFNYAARNPKARFVINKDDANADYFIAAAAGHSSILFGKSDMPSMLFGEFNAYNVGAAVATVELLGIAPDVIRSAVAQFPGVRGRMEFVQKEPFAVVVDYAVTPDSLEAVYKTLKTLSPKLYPLNPRLICVFGCTGGGRDAWKRPVMGKIAAEQCDEIILTDDDSYDEKPTDIIDDIARGIALSPKPLLLTPLKIIDRREAITKAISLARPGDTVAITGKGGDRWLRVAGGKKIPWSDQEVVSDILKEL